MGYYDDPSPAPIARRVTIDPKPNSNVNVTKEVTVRVKSLNEVEMGTHWNPSPTKLDAILTSGEYEGEAVVTITMSPEGKWGVDDMLAGLQALKRSL